MLATTDKHILDSSVVRCMLAGTQTMRDYFRTAFSGQRIYVPVFVKMEIRRSLLSPLVNFYFCLMAPNRTGIGDAIELWKNRFSKGEHIAVETMLASLFKCRKLDLNSLRDKSTALVEVGRYIRNLERKLDGFADSGQDSARCARAAIHLDAAMESMTQDLQRFLDAFDDTAGCRSRCRIKEFILDRYGREVQQYVKLAETIEGGEAHAVGFKKIAAKLKKVVEREEKPCSCFLCGGIGDAVIALDGVRDMSLEHTDRSFDYLCPPLKQVHKFHESDLALNRTIAEGEETDDAGT